MIQLSISAACSYVRRVMDELVSVEDIGLLASPDGVDIHRLVEGAIVEAVVKTHNDAPALLIDGIAATSGVDYDVKVEEKVATITMLKDTIRVASLKANDSSIVICEFVAEDSAEGRKQLNKYVRGIPDDPRVVLAKKWADNYKPVMKYYTTEKSQEEFDLDLTYVPYPEIEETIVMICPQLEYAVLNEISAMVLESLGEKEKAALCRARVAEYIKGQ